MIGPASITADTAYGTEGDSSGDVSRSGFPVVNARPDSDAFSGTARSMMLSALAPTATETRRSALWPPSGSAMVTMSASATSRLRSAMRRSEATASSGSAARIPRVIAAVACSHSPRRRAASYRWELSITAAAVAARAVVSSSSSALNSPRVLSVR